MKALFMLVSITFLGAANAPLAWGEPHTARALLVPQVQITWSSYNWQAKIRVRADCEAPPVSEINAPFNPRIPQSLAEVQLEGLGKPYTPSYGEWQQRGIGGLSK